jgi:Zn-dependent peptidase ImmA (M78 family)
MAVIRRYDRRQDQNQVASANRDLIDTPEKLLTYAQQQGLTIVPLDVEGVAKAFDIDIKKESLENELSGILRKMPESNKWEMLINAKHHSNRQRYTIAHELGHYFLHRHLQVEFQDRIFFRGAESSKEELQANSFASEVLMPENYFREMIREGKNKIDELAQEFGVSTLALRIRAKNLGMSGHGL